jgi:hypothetical protein
MEPRDMAVTGISFSEAKTIFLTSFFLVMLISLKEGLSQAFA